MWGGGRRRLNPKIIITFAPPSNSSKYWIYLPANSFPARKISDMNEGIVE